LFDFLDNDWFIITLEIVFLVLIIYDIRQYIKTKKKEYITNTVLTLAFAVWTLMPMYTKYFGWEDEQKEKMLAICNDSKDSKLCNCVDESILKQYTYNEYNLLDKNASEYKEFLKDTKEDCLDDGWF